MSTAIARMVTTEGLVIAADCRKFDREKNVVVSESAQKIFPVMAKKLAYILSGTTVITRAYTDEVIFDFVSETAKAVGALPEHLNDVRQCASALKTVLRRALLLAIGEIPGWWRCLAENQTIISVDGHSGGDLELREVVFDYQPDDFCHGRDKGGWIGSQSIINVLYDRTDPRLEAYKLSPGTPSTLLEGVSAAKKYILAYSDPEAREIDPKTCAAVGSRLHIATITQADGFRWVPGFEAPL
jgi:hypothetical protein